MNHPLPDPTRPPLLLTVPDTLAARQVGTGETYGRPGASAHASYRRRRTAEWTLYQRTLPLRLAGVTLTSLVVALAVDQVVPALAGWAAVVAASVVGWRLRFRVSQDARNWQRGARGERRTARQLTGSPAMAGSSSTISRFPARAPTPTTSRSAPPASS